MFDFNITLLWIVSDGKSVCPYIERYNENDIRYGEEKCTKELHYICLNGRYVPLLPYTIQKRLHLDDQCHWFKLRFK